MDAWMLEGWTPFLLISLGTIVVVFLLSRKLARRTLYSISLGIGLLCIGAFFFSMLVIGGWDGMGIGIISICILIGTLIGTLMGGMPRKV